MMGQPKRRSTTLRDLHRKIIRRAKPDCHICRHPIDYELPYLDPGEFTVDHLVPINKGGPETLDNSRAAHRSCNRTKSDRIDWRPPVDPIMTTRRWW